MSNVFQIRERAIVKLFNVTGARGEDMMIAQKSEGSPLQRFDWNFEQSQIVFFGTRTCKLLKHLFINVEKPVMCCCRPSTNTFLSEFVK